MQELVKSPNPYLKNLLELEFQLSSIPVDLIRQRYENILKEKGVEAAYRWTSFLFSGDKAGVLSEKSLEIWNQCITEKKISIAPEIFELCSILKKHGWKMVIVTASPTHVIRAVSEKFFIPREHVFGMELEIRDEIVTESIREPFTYGRGKVLTLDKNLGRIPDLAFGDSRNDLPLLLHSKQGILLSRGDRELERELKSGGVIIQEGFV